MSMNTKGIYYHLSAAADVARPMKETPGGFDQGVQDGLDQALLLVRESLGRKGSLECLAAFCERARSSADKGPYRAGVSHGAEIIQASLDGYVDDQNAKRVRRPAVSLSVVDVEAAETPLFPVEAEAPSNLCAVALIGEDA